MKRCNAVRDLLALDPADDTVEVRDHLAHCEACQAYRRQQGALDTVLRTEMHWEVAPALTAQLLKLAAMPLADLPTTVRVTPRLPVPPPRPQGWYVTLIYMLTVAAVSLSLVIAWQFFGIIAGQLGIEAALAQLAAAPAQGIAQLNRTMPESIHVIDFLLRVRTQLMWLLFAAVLWAALDKWNPQFRFGNRQQIQS